VILAGTIAEDHVGRRSWPGEDVAWLRGTSLTPDCLDTVLDTPVPATPILTPRCLAVTAEYHPSAAGVRSGPGVEWGQWGMAQVRCIM
jgi:hypothetical protein